MSAETIESLRAELAGLKDLLDSSVLRGQGYCGGRHWNGGTCFHPAGHPEGFPAHYGQDAEARAVAAEFDKANLAREVDHLQRESAHAHERIAEMEGELEAYRSQQCWRTECIVNEGRLAAARVIAAEPECANPNSGCGCCQDMLNRIETVLAGGSP